MDEYKERTPGLFKEEYAAQKLICLAAKSYYATPFEVTKSPKFGAKGIQKSNNLNMEMYDQSLFKNTVHQATNKGFRMCKTINNNIGLQYYEQTKRGVNPNYNKRHVFENKINTYPRDNVRVLCNN